MKKYLFFTILFCMLFWSTPLFSAPSFSDVQNHWAEKDIYYMADQGLVSGYPDGTFVPNRAITRGEMVMILSMDGKADLTQYSGKSGYSDVDSHWAKTAIQWATDKGVVTGYPNGTFQPQGKITRQEMASMLYRYVLGVSHVDFPSNHPETTFADDKAIGSWAKTAVYTMQKAGIISGMTSSTFVPQGQATRGQSASMLARYVRIANGEDNLNQGNAKYYVNGNLEDPLSVVTDNGIAMVSARSFFEPLKYRLSFYNTSSLVTFANHEKNLQLWLGRTKAFANGNPLTLPVAPKMINGATYIPISNLGTPLGLSISVKEEDDGQVISVTHSPTAVNLSALSFYGSASSGSAVNGQINFGDSQGFIGTIANGQMQYGSYTLTNGTSYFGNWRGGTLNGNGTLVNRQGDLSVGTFTNGHLTTGTTFYADGSFFTGTWNYTSAGAIYPDTGQYTDANGKTYGTPTSSWSGGALRL